MKLRHNLLCTAIAASTLAGLPLSSALAVGNVKLLFNSNPRAIALSKTAPAITNGINFYPHNTEKFLQMRLAEPLLCAEFPTGSNSHVRFKLLDANGDQVITSGVNNTFGSLTAISGNTGGIRYQSNGGDHQLILNTTSELVCYTYDTFATPAVVSTGGKAAQGLRYSLVPVSGNVVAKGGSPDGVFADGFESPFVAPLDVVTTLNAPQNVRADQTYTYTITVSNTAAAASVSGVVVRDFYYKAGSTNVSGAAVFQAGTWSCAASAGGSCGSSTGTRNGAIYAPDIALGAGAQVTFTANRPFITSPAPATGAQFSVAAAAFTPPTAGELVQSNNSVSATGTIVVTQPPVIAGLPTTTQTILEDSTFGPIAFSISDPDPEGITNATVIASSNNQALVANSGAVIGGSGAARTLTVTPVPNANGTAGITVTATDGQGNPSSKVVNLAVTAVNDAPSFTFRSDCVIKGNGSWNPSSNPAEFVFSAGTIGSQTCTGFTVPDFGPGESGQALAEVIVDSNSNPGLFVAGQLPRFSNALNQLQFQTTGVSGQANIAIRIRDNGGTTNGGVDTSVQRIFRIRVQGAAPTISTISTQAIDEDSSTGSIAFTVADADTAPASLTVTASSSNSGLIPSGNVVLGGSGSNRTVAVTPLADQFGSATITLTVDDGAQQSQQAFVVNVASVNDAPSFTSLGDQSFATGISSGFKQVPNWVTSSSVGPANEAAAPESQVLLQYALERLDSNVPDIINGNPGVAVSVVNGLMTIPLRGVGGVTPNGFACFRVTQFDSGNGSAPNVNYSEQIVKIQVGPGTFSCAGLRPSAKRDR